MNREFFLNFKRFSVCLFTLLFTSTVIFSQNAQSSSTVNWEQQQFLSNISLENLNTSLPLPSIRSGAARRIQSLIPSLLKDPFLSLRVDSASTVADMVLQSSITLDQIASVMSGGNSKPAVFSSDLETISVDHSFSLNQVGALMVKHNTPYSPTLPIETVASRQYTGIIIDARGNLPVQGEFVEARGEPCFFPKIWDETMELLYERNMMNADAARKSGIVVYSSSDDESLYQDRVGISPLRISARKIFGTFRTDPVISRNDALRILSVPENLELLKQGKIVILLDEEMLFHAVGAPEKNRSYYTVYDQLEQFHYERKIDDVSISDESDGIHISIEDLNFYPDSAELLPEENDRLAAIIERLVDIADIDEYSFLVEGHCAAVGKPDGEMQLSYERAETIVSLLKAGGLEGSGFEARGYGGTKPIGDNSTEEGRAKNRRVEIVMRPKVSYVQRQGD